MSLNTWLADNLGMAWSKIVSLYSTRRGLGIDLGREKIRWMPPPAEFYKLNTDGAVEQGTNEATAGGLIQDCRGDWLIGFFRNIGACSVLNSELWAMYDGMRLAWRKVIKRVIIWWRLA
ncbi:hypothetical protein PVK06_004249 [Gossypium arboreum]|uniref:RNase H type-1 domain-containing protein n=1 Tax=Gossypium arboreum TaxID=29729 RepID=A0ABR0QSJ3_GOSAR|nr:hypothetical protein PVK06_004249 [Gossypium arboreum]